MRIVSMCNSRDLKVRRAVRERNGGGGSEKMKTG